MSIKANREIILAFLLTSIVIIPLVVTTASSSYEKIVVVHGSTVTIDGTIEDYEWNDASRIAIPTTGGADCTVHAKRDDVNLYVALDVPDATYNNSDSCVLIVDVNYDRSKSLQTDDVWLRVSRTGVKEEYNVTAGGWFPTSVSGWAAEATSTADAWQAEYNITYSKVNVTADTDKMLGIMFLLLDKAVASYPKWPPDASITSPVTWGEMSVDTTPPVSSIISPENKTYPVTEIPLTFTLSEKASWIGYSLDGRTNVTVSGNTTLFGLSDEDHNLILYFRDAVGNIGVSDPIYFTVDTISPDIVIITPENMTYSTSFVPLSFVSDEATSWIGYSLDDQMNATISGNTTLASLSEGTHTIMVFANDTIGNIGASETTYFTIDTIAPHLEILSPKNRTYTTNFVPLSFVSDEATSWIGYSLDGETTVTISGNITLSGISDGFHGLIVFAKDIAGNTGASEVIHFSIISPQEFFPAQIVGATLLVVGGGAALLVYLTRFRKEEEDTRNY